MTLEYDPDNHKYSINGKNYISVTTIIAKLFPFNAEIEAERIVLQNRDGIYKDKTKGEILSMWRGKAASGTNLHSKIENYLLGTNNIDTSIEFSYFLNFIKEFTPTIYKTELRIFDTEFEIAGAVDVIINNNDGTYTVADWKRIENKDIYNDYNKFINLGNFGKIGGSKYMKYSLQLNIYSYILKKNYGLTISNMCLILLHPDDYVLINIEPINTELLLKECKLKRYI